MTGALRLDQCPGCGSKGLLPISAGEQTNFFCDDCRLCWYVDEHGWVNSVDPQTCPGCRLGKASCVSGLGARHSR